MKSNSKFATVLAIFTLGLFAATYAGTRMNNAETVTMTSNTHTITLAPNTAEPLTPVAIELAFKSKGDNTLTFDYIRNGYTNAVVNRAVTNCATYIIFIPRDLKLLGNDRLVFTKTRVDQAQLTINWK